MTMIRNIYSDSSVCACATSIDVTLFGVQYPESRARLHVFHCTPLRYDT